MEIEVNFRTRRFINELSKVLLQLVFRWSDVGTGGVVTLKWKIRNRFTALETGGMMRGKVCIINRAKGRGGRRDVIQCGICYGTVKMRGWD